MRLISKIELYDYPYYILLNETAKEMDWYLISLVNPDDFILPENKRRILNVNNIKNLSDEEYNSYLVEAIKINKISGVKKFSKGYDNLIKIISCFNDCRDFSYPKSSILENTTEVLDLKLIEIFKAVYESYRIDYKKVGGIFQTLVFTNGILNINFIESKSMKIPKKLEFEELILNDDETLNKFNVDQLNEEVLRQVVDLSWYYNKDGSKKKKYTVINNIEDFESKFIYKMISKMQEEISKGVRPVISIDTETSGVNFRNLSKGNPNKDKISTIQFSWEDDQGVIVFLDMKYFQNISQSYVFERLKDLFGYTHIFNYGVPTKKGEKGGKLKFHLLYNDKGEKIDEFVELNRNDYDIVGHNVKFDSKVTLDCGHQFYFDHDTLQMVFNLNPLKNARPRGLKYQVKYFFDIEMSELSDILGKGNEGNFRFIKDEEVTKIYGCADVDFDRKLFFKLKEITPEDMFNSYSRIDPITWYIFAQAEYYGTKANEEKAKHICNILKKDRDTIKVLAYKYVNHMINLKLKINKSEDFISEDDMYVFEFKANDLRKVMYDILNYPITYVTEKTGEPAVNKPVMKKLMSYESASGVEVLKEDVMSADGKSVLIKAKEFNKYKYPLCYLISKYSDINKDITGYYDPLIKDNLEGKLFKPINTASIITRRISCPLQTVKKVIKDIIIPYSEDYYLGDWDENQIEARNFDSEAGDEESIIKMCDPEKDVHTENAALMFSTKPHLVTKDQRKKSKVFKFGIPYGKMEYSLCVDLFGSNTEDNMVKTRILYKKFCDANGKAMTLLEGYRKQAITPINVSPELKDFWCIDKDSKVGLVKNTNGFYRQFYLDDVLGDRRMESKKGREGGNFPIQSKARDIFITALHRMYDRLVRDGVQDKFIFHVPIHDEILFSVHKSISPEYVAKVCAEECVFKLPKQTIYYIGLSFGNSWLDCKNDANEIPTKMLMEYKSDETKYNPNNWQPNNQASQYMLPLINSYKQNRYLDVCKEILGVEEFPDIIDISIILDGFTNYMVRSYGTEFGKSYTPIKKMVGGVLVDDELDLFSSYFCNIMVIAGLEEKRIKLYNKVYKIKDLIDLRNSSNKTESDKEFEIDLFDEEIYLYEDSDKSIFFCLDDDNIDDIINEYIEPVDLYEIDSLKQEKEYDYIKLKGKTYYIKFDKQNKLKELLKFLEPYKDPNGYTLNIETNIKNNRVYTKYSINFDKVEEYIKKEVG